MKKKILVVSQYFFPEQFRINDICSEWVKKGYNVTVLTGIPNYPKGSFFKGYGFFKKRSETIDGINIIRIPLIPRKKSSIFLALNYISFLISGNIWAIFTKKKFDEVFIYEVSPMTQAVPGIKYAIKHKVKSTIYVMDLWPENFVELSGITNKKIIALITRMVKYIYTNVDNILISSPGFRYKINDLGDFDSKIIYWPQYAEDYYQPATTSSDIVKLDSTNFNITFAGNIGFAQGLDILPDVAKELSTHNLKANINLIGNGRYKDELIERIHHLELEEYFSFFDPINPEEIPKVLKDSDVALVSLSSNPIFSLTIPAKVQSLLATGTPLLISADGILKDLIDDSKAGLWSEAGDVVGLTDNIKKFMSYSDEQLNELKNNALLYSRKEFSKEKLLNKIDNLWGDSCV